MSEIPKGWIETTLDEACTKISDGTHHSPKEQYDEPAEGRYKYITAKNIRMAGLDLGNLTYVPEKVHREIYNRCNPELGDVLLTKDGVNTGDVALNTLEEEFSLLSSVALLKPNRELLDPIYLRYYIESPQGTKRLIGEMRGAAIRRIILRSIKAARVPIPPLSDQRRIVARVEELFSQLDAGVAALRHAKAQLKRYRQSVLAAAVTGKLTKEWREQNKHMEWKTLMLENLIVSTANGLSKRRGTEGEQTTILRLADFKDAKRITGNERQITLSNKEIEKYTLKPEDILVIRVNGSVDLAGKFIQHQVYGETEGYCDHFIRIRIDLTRVSPAFLTYVANEGAGRDFLKNKLSTSAGQNTINQTSIKSLPIDLPPLAEQLQIAAEVEARTTAIDRLEAELDRQITRSNRLRQSILVAAFSGRF